MRYIVLAAFVGWLIFNCSSGAIEKYQNGVRLHAEFEAQLK